MDKNLEANQKYETIEGADDVLLLDNKNTFTIRIRSINRGNSKK